MISADIAAERAALEQAIAERQRQIDKAATLQWCAERTAGREQAMTVEYPEYDHVVDRTPRAETVVTRSAPVARSVPTVTLESHVAALGEVIQEEERKLTAEQITKLRAEFTLEITKLRNEFLSDRLDQERGVKRPLKVVPPLIG